MGRSTETRMDRTLETLRPSRQRAGAGAGRVISPQTRYEAEAVEALSFGGREGVSQDATTSNSYVPRRSHQRHIVIGYIVVQNIFFCFYQCSRSKSRRNFEK